MEVVYERCCGMDVHKDKIVACVMVGRKRETRTFGTMTDDLLQLIDWIKEQKCECVAMESTGVYWKPIYNLLELEEIKTLVVNAQHIKAVPGRKTDVKDSEWIADLLQHGLLKGSFIQNRGQRELKELVRYRRSMIEERAREVNRIQKVLEGANIKLSSVASDILGVSGKLILQSLAQGIEDPKKLIVHAKGAMKNKAAELERSLKGLIGEHQKMMISTQLRHIEYLDGILAQLDMEVKQRIHPFEEQVALLDSITGVGRRSAETIIAEIGIDMSVFPSAAHLSSWAGMCPGNNESAGKKKSGKTRKGNNTLRTTLVECANSLGRSKGYLAVLYRRICARRGKKKAAVAVGHTILEIAYYILKNKTEYRDLGADYFDNLKKQSIVNRTVKRLQSLGYKVSIEALTT
jgi:transposase